MWVSIDMACDKLNVFHLKEFEKGHFSFRNDAPAQFKGKWIITLDGDAKAQNVILVDGLNHNILSVSQMCHHGYDVILRSKYCQIRNS